MQIILSVDNFRGQFVSIFIVDQCRPQNLSIAIFCCTKISVFSEFDDLKMRLINLISAYIYIAQSITSDYFKR